MNMKNILLLIWMCAFFTVGMTDGENLSATACFSGDICNHCNLACPQSQMIRLIEAEYRYKRQNNCKLESCNSRQSCCYLNESDCKTTYSPLHTMTLYNKCSGNQTCVSIRAEQGNTYNCMDKPNDRQRYIHVKYSCIPDTEVIDMCYSPTKMNFSKVNIMLVKQPQSTSVTSECKCFVESQGNVSYQLVDIRFFTLREGSENYTCTSGNLRINGLFIQCSSDNKAFFYQGSDKFDGQLHGTNEINLKYSQRYTPKMVWIYINGLTKYFSIHCVNATSIEADKNNDAYDFLPTIIGVVIAAIIMTTVVAVAVIMFKRQQKIQRKDDTHNSEFPNRFIYDTYERHDDAAESNAVISNYDSINDNSILTVYSLTVKKNKDTTDIPESANKYGDVSADEYDRIELEKKVANKVSNYDHLPEVKEKLREDTYSRVTNQSTSVTTATATADDYSHCKLTQRNDNNYSHVELDEGHRKNKQPNTNKEDGSYDHIQVDYTKEPKRNGKAVIGENEYESEKTYPTCSDVK